MFSKAFKCELSNAEIKIKSRVNFILEKIGGDGVIRELSDIILSNINHD